MWHTLKNQNRSQYVLSCPILELELEWYKFRYIFSISLIFLFLDVLTLFSICIRFKNVHLDINRKVLFSNVCALCILLPVYFSWGLTLSIFLIKTGKRLYPQSIPRFDYVKKKNVEWEFIKCVICFINISSCTSSSSAHACVAKHI